MGFIQNDTVPSYRLADTDASLVLIFAPLLPIHKFLCEKFSFFFSTANYHRPLHHWYRHWYQTPCFLALRCHCSDPHVHWPAFHTSSEQDHILANLDCLWSSYFHNANTPTAHQQEMNENKK